MDLGLKGKVSVITGSSRGIGRATAIALAREGARVVVCARGAEQLEEAAGAVRAAGGEALAVAADLTTAEGVDHVLAEARAKLGPVDLLVNNVGGSRGKPTWEASDAEWEEVLGINLLPAIRASRAVIPSMIEPGATALTRTLWGASWRDICFAKASSAALAAL